LDEVDDLKAKSTHWQEQRVSWSAVLSPTSYITSDVMKQPLTYTESKDSCFKVKEIETTGAEEMGVDRQIWPCWCDNILS